jgi:hypothetical protein
MNNRKLSNLLVESAASCFASRLARSVRRENRFTRSRLENVENAKRAECYDQAGGDTVHRRPLRRTERNDINAIKRTSARRTEQSGMLSSDKG